MRASRSILFWFCFAISPVAAGCQPASDSYVRKLIGGIEVKGDEIKGPLPQRLPRIIYVADFALDAEN